MGARFLELAPGEVCQSVASWRVPNLMLLTNWVLPTYYQNKKIMQGSNPQVGNQFFSSIF